MEVIDNREGKRERALEVDHERNRILRAINRFLQHEVGGIPHNPTDDQVAKAEEQLLKLREAAEIMGAIKR